MPLCPVLRPFSISKRAFPSLISPIISLSGLILRLALISSFIPISTRPPDDIRHSILTRLSIPDSLSSALSSITITLSSLPIYPVIALKKVVLPVDVPPDIKMLAPDCIIFLRNSAASAVMVPISIRFSMDIFILGNFLMVSIGPPMAIFL